MYRVLVTDDIGAEGLAQLAAAPDAQVDALPGLSRAGLLERIGEYEAVITRSGTALDAAVFAAARLFAVADVWDALRSDRPYRGGWPEEKVQAHIRGQAGKHFDPKVVEVFLRMI